MTQHPDEGTLHAYIDGELPQGETSELERHIAECAQCAAALAEARGFVAAASRAIIALDAAPSSAGAARPAAVAPAGPASSPRVRPPIFRVPLARAAALLLLAGGAAVVLDRSGTLTGEESAPAQSRAADAMVLEERAAAAVPAPPIATPEAAPPATVAPARDLATTTRVAARAGSTARKTPASVGASADAADDSSRRDQRMRTIAEPRAAVAAGVSGQLAGKAVAATPVPSAPPPSAPPPSAPAPAARAELTPEAVALSAAAITPSTRVTRFRTKEGIVLTLTEEPLRTSFAQETVTARRIAPRAAAAPMAAPVVNAFRWSSAEQGRRYTLSGPLPVVELEALAHRLAELERLP